ncbi:hypothetical protein [Bosea sp. (in: a-proteobacteria)]|jgi:hypothetical protein|uniref:hypothetical protein n=1 Tax=Bosea sp. (in: a-proteobacteria) TaxID=1871050 RepID=UPI003567E0B2
MHFLGLALAKKIKLTCVASAIPLLSGCAAIDAFSPRAGDFNQQTANTKSASILSNIVRAAYAEPLQFTDITTAQGSGNVQASTGSNLPFPFRGGLGVPLAQQALTFSPSAQASASNQWVVQNLNTQEFYNGIQTPISSQLIAYFMSIGFDKRILLPILVSEMEIIYAGRRNLFRNELDTTSKSSEIAQKDFSFFYQAMSYLVEGGFSGEQISDSTSVGPELTSSQARDARLLSALVSPTGTDTLSLREVKKDTKYQLTRKSPSFRFCFDHTREASDRWTRRYGALEFLSAPATPRPATVVLGQSNNKQIPELTLRLNAGDYCGADAAARKAQTLDLTFKIRTRSVEGVFSYLGAMVRTQLGLADGSPQSLTVLGGTKPSFDVFKVETGFGSANGLAISHRGQSFGINVDPSGRVDGSSRVLQLLTTLIALQSSAKNQPSPNMITVLGQ